MNIKVTADSTCDLSADILEEYNIAITPLTVIKAGTGYIDGVTITPAEIFAHVAAGGDLCSTSAVSVGEFHDAMRPILESGKDILCVSFSSALSTTYQSSVIAAEELKDEFPDAKILTVDSLCASLGQGLFVYLCAQEQKKGKTIDEVKTFAEETKGRVCHWFTVDDLNYLKKGGRVSAATALVGTMLSIKPIMHTSDEGKLTVVGKARGRKSSLNTLIDTVGRLGINLQDQVMFICQADCQAEAETVAAQLKQRYGVKEVYINYIGPVIGSHTGPNTMGLFFVGTKR